VASTYQLVAVSGIGSRYHVVRPDGLPDVPLTLFANEQLKSLAPSSVPLYVREILVLLNWARTDPVVNKEGWKLTGPPAAVRNLIREYLCVGAKCKLTTRPDNQRVAEHRGDRQGRGRVIEAQGRTDPVHEVADRRADPQGL
jgi:hypothetical protein